MCWYVSIHTDIWMYMNIKCPDQRILMSWLELSSQLVLALCKPSYSNPKGIWSYYLIHKTLGNLNQLFLCQHPGICGFSIKPRKIRLKSNWISQQQLPKCWSLWFLYHCYICSKSFSICWLYLWVISILFCRFLTPAKESLFPLLQTWWRMCLRSCWIAICVSSAYL